MKSSAFEKSEKEKKKVLMSEVACYEGKRVQIN